MTRTQWFPGDQKPVRVGVYEQGTRQSHNPRKICGGIYSYWDGEFWRSIALSPMQAMNVSMHLSKYQNEPWRGLADKPGDR